MAITNTISFEKSTAGGRPIRFRFDTCRIQVRRYSPSSRITSRPGSVNPLTNPLARVRHTSLWAGFPDIQPPPIQQPNIPNMTITQRMHGVWDIPPLDAKASMRQVDRTGKGALHPRSLGGRAASPRAPCLVVSAKDGAQRSARPTVNLWMHCSLAVRIFPLSARGPATARSPSASAAGFGNIAADADPVTSWP